MTIKIADDRLSQALRTMQRLAQPDVVTLLFKEQHMYLKGAGQTGCSAKIKLEVENDGDNVEVTVDLGTLSSVIDKLKNLELTITDSVLNIKAKGYKIDLTAIDGQPIEVVPKEILKGEEGFSLGGKLMAELLQVLPKIELRPLLSTYAECPIGIKAGPKGTFVACFDFVQSAFVKLETPAKEPFEFILPSISQFNTLVREMAGQKYRLVITDTSLYAFNDMFQVALALPQAEGEQLQLSDVLGLVKSLKELSYKKLILKTEAVKQFLSNSQAVYDKDSLFTLTAKGDKAKMELKGTVGNTAMVTKMEESVDEVSFKCDLKFFGSIVNKSNSKKLVLQTTNDLLLLREGKISYLMSLV